MGQAIGFAATIVVLGVFLPNVLGAFEELLLTLLIKITYFIEILNIPQ